MTYSLDLDTDVGKCRLLVHDTARDGWTDAALFSDEEYDAFLGMEQSSVKRAAALALETVASNDAYTLKVTKLPDLQVDGVQVATSLMKRAATLREQAANDELAEDGGAFDFAEWVVDPFSARDRAYNEVLRTGG